MEVQKRKGIGISPSEEELSKEVVKSFILGSLSGSSVKYLVSF